MICLEIYPWILRKLPTTSVVGLSRLRRGLFVNLEIVRQGYGHVYTRFPFKHMELFRYYGNRARTAGKGVYGSSQLSVEAGETSAAVGSVMVVSPFKVLPFLQVYTLLGKPNISRPKTGANPRNLINPRQSAIQTNKKRTTLKSSLITSSAVVNSSARK